MYERRERHIGGLVGHLFRVKDPATVRIGDCFMEGRLLEGDLVLCKAHSGDCFQTYIFVREFSNALQGLPHSNFGSYGIGDSKRLGKLPPIVFEQLCSGETAYFPEKKEPAQTKVEVEPSILDGFECEQED